MEDEIVHDLGERTATPDAPAPDEIPPWDAPDLNQTAADASDLDAFLLAGEIPPDGT